MSWVFVVSMVALMLAIVLIELRAVRAGDEREHHAPGYAMVLGGLVLIGFGIAAAISDHGALTLLFSVVGLVSVALGATRHKEMAAH